QAMTDKGGQPSRLFQAVVDALQQDVRVAGAPTGPLRVRARRGDDGGNGILPIDGDYAAAQAIVRRVERDREVDRQRLSAQPLDEWHQANGRDGHPPGT